MCNPICSNCDARLEWDHLEDHRCHPIPCPVCLDPVSEPDLIRGHDGKYSVGEACPPCWEGIPPSVICNVGTLRKKVEVAEARIKALREALASAASSLDRVGAHVPHFAALDALEDDLRSTA